MNYFFWAVSNRLCLFLLFHSFCACFSLCKKCLIRESFFLPLYFISGHLISYPAAILKWFQKSTSFVPFKLLFLWTLVSELFASVACFSIFFLLIKILCFKILSFSLLLMALLRWTWYWSSDCKVHDAWNGPKISDESIKSKWKTAFLSVVPIILCFFWRF